jgi:hypothetical protein
MGFCAGYDRPGYVNPGVGFGRGRGWRHRAYATGRPGWGRFDYAPGWDWEVAPSREEEVAFLRAQAEQLRIQLDALNRHIADLETDE